MKLFFPFPKPTVRAHFVCRPQRFLAQVRLRDGSTTIAYCANPGSFSGCLDHGSPALLGESLDPKRKRRFTLRAIKQSRTWIGTDTHLTNQLAEKAFVGGLIPGFEKAGLVRREPRSPRGCRLDFLLRDEHGDRYVEVKSVMVASGGVAQFPDSISPRATAHLNELAKLAKQGHRACLLFVIQRGDVQRMEINCGRDKAFTRALRRAMAAGVQMMAVKHAVTMAGFGEPVPVPVALAKGGR